MRINMQSLDPLSPLALRIRAAVDRDQTAREKPTGTGENAGAPGQCTPPQASVTAPRYASEDHLHREIFRMCAAEVRAGVIVFHAANGGRRNKAEAGKLKGMGVVAGIPDLIAIVNGKAYGLEIKTDRGTLSNAQKIMRQRFVRAGAEYEVARSVAGARQILEKWGAVEIQKKAAA